MKSILAQAQLTPTLPNARHWLKFYIGSIVQEAGVVGVSLSKES